MVHFPLYFFGAMEIVSSPLYPRYLPFDIPPHESVAVVGHVVNLDEQARRLTLQPDLDSTLHHNLCVSTLDINLPQSFECSELRSAKMIEVRGISEANRTITMKEYCNFRDNFDLKTYNEVLKLSNHPDFRRIFGIRQ